MVSSHLCKGKGVRQRGPKAQRICRLTVYPFTSWLQPAVAASSVHAQTCHVLCAFSRARNAGAESTPAALIPPQPNCMGTNHGRVMHTHFHGTDVSHVGASSLVVLSSCTHPRIPPTPPPALQARLCRTYDCECRPKQKQPIHRLGRQPPLNGACRGEQSLLFHHDLNALEVLSPCAQVALQPLPLWIAENAVLTSTHLDRLLHLQQCALVFLIFYHSAGGGRR
jgi:hypothetical protein